MDVSGTRYNFLIQLLQGRAGGSCGGNTDAGEYAAGAGESAADDGFKYALYHGVGILL